MDWSAEVLLGDHWCIQLAVRCFHMVGPLCRTGDGWGRDIVAAALRTGERLVEGALVDMMAFVVPGERVMF